MSALLDDATKAELREILAAERTIEAHIQSATTVVIGGRPTTTYADREVCFVRKSTLSAPEQERLMGGAVGAPTLVAVFFPAGTELRLTDRLVLIGVTPTDDGDVAWTETYSVTALGAQDTSAEVERRVIATELA